MTPLTTQEEKVWLPRGRLNHLEEIECWAEEAQIHLTLAALSISDLQAHLAAANKRIAELEKALRRFAITEITLTTIDGDEVVCELCHHGAMACERESPDWHDANCVLGKEKHET
jgi:hypothetical protein